MITALTLAATLAACHADMLAYSEHTKQAAAKTYPKAAEDLQRTEVFIGTPAPGRLAEVVYGGFRPKVPKGWGFVPVDYNNRITLSSKLCDLPVEKRHEAVRHELGHVLARAERGQWIVDSEAVADAYGDTLGDR